MWVGLSVDGLSENKFKDRVRWVSYVFAILFGGLSLRLFYIQVIRGDDYAQISESNRTQTIFLNAPRGNIYDFEGRVLVGNRPSWSLVFSVSEKTTLTPDSVINRLRPFLDPGDPRWPKKVKEAFRTKQMVRLVEDVPRAKAFGIQELGYFLPGVQMVMEFRRDYPLGIFAPQMIGYLGEIDERELKDNQWYERKSGDIIGKMGLERVLDGQLRGQDGGMLMEVDSFGRLKRIIENLPYESGPSIRLTLDAELQRTAQDELEKTSSRRGAVVVMDVKTGAIRVWASAPPFDPRGKLLQEIQDPNQPFFDRVYRGSYPPGSLFKIITAIAGFEKGVINPVETINCVGFVSLPDRKLGERRYKCWKKHGVVNFWQAVYESCDSYFYNLADKVGPFEMAFVAKQFGLGSSIQKTLPSENPGTIPDPNWKRRKKLGGWSTGDTYNMGIGQGYMVVTPLQMATFLCGVASKGIVPRPYILDGFGGDQGHPQSVSKPEKLSVVELKEKTWADISKAMYLVVERGTGFQSHVPYLDIYGKTGTAQNPHGVDHAWFGSFGGYKGEVPTLAICVFVENGGNGSTTAAPIARKIYEAAFPPNRTKGAS